MDIKFPSRHVNLRRTGVSPAAMDGESKQAVIQRPRHVTVLVDEALGKDLPSRTVQQLQPDGRRAVTALKYSMPITDPAGAPLFELDSEIPLRDAPLALADVPDARTLVRFIALTTSMLTPPVPPRIVGELARRVCAFVRDTPGSNLSWQLSLLLAELMQVEVPTQAQLAAILDPLMDPANGLTPGQVLVGLRHLPLLQPPFGSDEGRAEVVLQSAQAAIGKLKERDQRVELARIVLSALGPSSFDGYKDPAHLRMLLKHVVKFQVQAPEVPALFLAWLAEVQVIAPGEHHIPTVLEMLDQVRTGSRRIGPPTRRECDQASGAFATLMGHLCMNYIDMDGPPQQLERDLQALIEWSRRQPNAQAALAGLVPGLLEPAGFKPAHVAQLVRLLAGARLDPMKRCVPVQVLAYQLDGHELVEPAHVQAFFEATHPKARPLPRETRLSMDRQFVRSLCSRGPSPRALEALSVALQHAAAGPLLEDVELSVLAQELAESIARAGVPSPALKSVAGVLLDPALPPHRSGELLWGMLAGLGGDELADEVLAQVLVPLCTNPSFDGPTGAALVAYVATALCTADDSRSDRRNTSAQITRVAAKLSPVPGAHAGSVIAPETVQLGLELAANPLMAARKSRLPEAQQLACIQAAYRIPKLLDEDMAREQLWGITELVPATGVGFALPLVNTLFAHAARHVTPQQFRDAREYLVKNVAQGDDAGLEPGAPESKSKPAKQPKSAGVHAQAEIGLVDVYRSYWQNAVWKGEGDPKAAQLRLLQGELKWLRQHASAERLEPVADAVEARIRSLEKGPVGKAQGRDHKH